MKGGDGARGQYASFKVGRRVMGATNRRCEFWACSPCGPIVNGQRAAALGLLLLLWPIGDREIVRRIVARS